MQIRIAHARLIFVRRRSRRWLWPDFNVLSTNTVLVVQIQGPRRAPRTPGWTFPFRLIDFSFFSFAFWSHQCEPSSLTGPDMVFKEEKQGWKTMFFSLWQRLISITSRWWLEGAYCHRIHSEFLFLRVFFLKWMECQWMEFVPPGPVTAEDILHASAKMLEGDLAAWAPCGRDKHAATENLILQGCIIPSIHLLRPRSRGALIREAGGRPGCVNSPSEDTWGAVWSLEHVNSLYKTLGWDQAQNFRKQRWSMPMDLWKNVADW